MLALAWSCPVSEAKKRCTWKEFLKWQTYYQIDPWGESRADWRSAMIAATFANCFSKRRYKPADFMPRFGADANTPRKSQEEMRSVFRRFKQAVESKNGK